MKTTLKKIKQHSPCPSGWTKLLTFLDKTEADDEKLALLTILESNGLQDALWALRCVEGHDREIRLMACDFAESVVHLTNDERCLNAIKVSRYYANGLATSEELDAASGAATAAARAADSDASYAARAAASTTAWAAARDAVVYARDARVAWAAASTTARTARDARVAAWAAAREEEEKKQIEIFKKYCK
jgi:hypothetical protein